MQDNSLEILLAAKKALDQIENGKLYTSVYIIDRLETAAEKRPHDGLIGNMKDVFSKKASNQHFFTQKEIGEIYDRMVGFGGGNSSFRDELGDLLPASRQFAETVKTSSTLRTESDLEALPVTGGDTELSKAFATFLGIGKEASFSTSKGREDNSVQKVVVAQLASIGMSPIEVKVQGGNDHFALCSAFFRTQGHTKVAVQVPVQISGGVARPPEKFINGEELMNLDKKSLFFAIKEAENEKRTIAISKFADQRGDGTQIDYAKAVMPSGLEKFADLENSLVAAASNYSPDDVMNAVGLVSNELVSFGAIRPHVKVASSNSKELVLDAHIPTERGNVVLHVPVEIHEGNPIIPSKFAVDIGPDSEKIYDFSRKGLERFAQNIKESDYSHTVSRQTGELSSMSYHQLKEQIIVGVSKNDYRQSEDALAVIQERFGGDQFKAALDYFTQLLKHSSDDSGSERSKLVQAAIDRGDLIKFPTTVEWYAPKLALPLSKIAFDEKGRLVPARKKHQSDNLVNGVLISTSKIVLT